MSLRSEYVILIISIAIALSLVLIKNLLSKRVKPATGRKIKESFTAYLYLLPSIIVLSLFTFWPVIYSFVLSFFKWDFQNQANPMFIGFENYLKLFRLKNPINVPIDKSFLNTIIVLTGFSFLMHVVFDLKKIKDKKIKNFIIFSAFVSIIGIVFNNYFDFLNFAIAIFLICAYVYLSVSKVYEGMTDRLIGRFIFFVIFYFIAVKLGVTELITYLSAAKEESDFIKSIWNTAYYVFLSTPITIFLALLVALLLNTKIRGKTFFRTVYFIPFVTSVVAISLVWQWIFNDNGLLNYILGFFGLSKTLWLKDEVYTIPTIAMISVWKMLGYYSVIFLSGLQNIDKSYYEAANVDGANSWHKFKYITWPLLSPTTFFIMIVSMIGAFKVFSEVFVLYSGMPGPYNNSGLTVVYYIYDKFYSQQRMGEASAAAYVLFAIIIMFSIVQLKAGKKRVHYDN